MLDFTSCADHLGKPAAADLKLGLATGPVLFACRQVRQEESLSSAQRACTALHTPPELQLQHTGAAEVLGMACECLRPYTGVSSASLKPLVDWYS